MVDFVFYENCKICDTKGKKIYSENYSDKNFVNFFSNFYGHINYNLLLDYVKHEKFELYKCEDCNFIWQRVEPDGEFSFLLYEEIIDKKVSYQKSIDIIQKRKQRFKTEFELIYNYFNVKKLNILDFGAGWGTWLDVIDRNKANLYAFEISPSRKTHLIKNGFTVLDENTIKNLYYPSINYKEFKKYNEKYFEKFKNYPSEITIMAYDSIGLIYYLWKKNGKVNSVNDFSFKGKIKGKIGTFSFDNKKIIQDLNIYKAENNKFTKF